MARNRSKRAPAQQPAKGHASQIPQSNQQSPLRKFYSQRRDILESLAEDMFFFLLILVCIAIGRYLLRFFDLLGIGVETRLLADLHYYLYCTIDAMFSVALVRKLFVALFLRPLT